MRLLPIWRPDARPRVGFRRRAKPTAIPKAIGPRMAGVQVLTLPIEADFITMNGDNLKESGHDRRIGILLDRIDVLAGK
ncbi:hypothetical protein [Mesorhizobium sp.]|uniref:hypothetical protein n=1 Tax=Mesorhizobium sp. TaxID=1871066 RepID=UPI000FE5C6A0|nr:hypothetical protein [Mesorhizobium sp.]RWK62527.1 MAG: hypothetical protein EOR49_13030 [Mesorhizobium sp.]RWM45758.1 MAG: hypothetical protein EOR76_20395 [Mesorhizobium sp.]RWM57905.1 MAG: hypothetical protein EOR78_07885 [Mesorhizobium sp.]RWM59254.1 MAG: hypothetical protein EOR79_10625 [Mesorhizobium sp.]RWM97540.1 MAG: hypothetical protein EOR85_20665 [Mesorhizobium sp.]